MITERQVDQAFADCRATSGGLKEDYFGLLYLEKEHGVPRERAVNQIAFGGNDYGIDGFHFDQDRRNLYIFQFKYSESHALFKTSFKRLIDAGLERLFSEPNRDDNKNQVLIQLRSCLLENRSLIDQICFRFVFTGDPAEADRSVVLDRLREDLENRKYLAEQFFAPREVGFLVDFRAPSGKIAGLQSTRRSSSFPVKIDRFVTLGGPGAEQMHIGFVRLLDLEWMYRELGVQFFERNIRYGLDESEAVNRSLEKALRSIVIDGTDDPRLFAFNHNGVTLYAEKAEPGTDHWMLASPRLLNGAQTVTTTRRFLDSNKDNPKLARGQSALESIVVLCKVITSATPEFITQVTINNNRQNPVEPWNLHANDLIQLELHEKFVEDEGIYYERQENAFNQLTAEILEEHGIKEDAKAIQMLKLTQTFLLTDGSISRLSEMRRVFEDERVYNQTFRQTRLGADTRKIVLCYKVQFRLRKLADVIKEKGQNKYWYVSRARSLLWALMCQAILNDPKIERLCDAYGRDLTIPAGFTDILNQLASSRVRVLLGALMSDADYQKKVAEENLSFLRTDRAFEKCMELGHKKWGWVHRKLV